MVCQLRPPPQKRQPLDQQHLHVNRCFARASDFCWHKWQGDLIEFISSGLFLVLSKGKQSSAIHQSRCSRKNSLAINWPRGLQVVGFRPKIIGGTNYTKRASGGRPSLGFWTSATEQFHPLHCCVAAWLH